ncbi:MAG TPA: hypothetical protein VJM81_09955 [Rhizorhapis sp.]|uniref:hypothetical protein n=1 Tax=Rhizorhapis sp. TaxID=1968842 RepID=UPI002B464585|nr:hypothetical protein [Rhizorhapis sp.]HKR17051.1 hypothetical protein [Rhizorhapis sp.]HKX23583.1 hypothetical protein [Rhizorhapis sp.]
MNNLTTSAGIRNALAANSLAITKAREDATLFERLKAAAHLADKLEADGKELTAKLSEVSAAEAKAERDALFAQFDSMTISYHFPERSGGGLLNARWEICWKRLAYSMDWRKNVMTEYKASDFTTLDHSYPDAYRYLVEAHPEKIPNIIMELSPDNPAEAMATYCASKRANRIIMPSRSNA